MNGWRYLCVGPVLALLLASCASPEKDPVLLTVGTQTTRLSEFQRAFDDILALKDSGFTPDTLSARRFLATYTDKTILEQIAADSIVWTPLLEHRARTGVENQLVRMLRQDAYGKATNISDEELRKLYEKGRTKYHFRAASFGTQAEAVQQMQAVREGAAFEKLASHVMNDPTGGDQGWQTVLTVPEGLIDLLATLAPGSVGGPVLGGGRYYLLQLIEKAPNPDLAAFEEIKPGLKIRVMQDRGGELLRRYHQDLIERYRFEPRMAEIIWITKFLKDTTQGVSREYPKAPPGGEVGDVEVQDESPWGPECPLNGEEQRRILATTTVDSINAVTLLDYLNGKLTFTWPTFDSPDDVMKLVRELAIDRMERAESWKHGYEKDPAIVYRDKKQRGLMLSRQFYTNRIVPVTRPTLEEAQAWYEAHSEQYSQPEKRRFVTVVVRDWDTAIAAREALARQRDVAAVLKQIQRSDPAATASDADGFTMSADQAKNPLEKQIYRLKVGEVSDPAPVGPGYVIARLEEVTPGVLTPFEGVSETVIGKLGEARGDSLLNALVQARKAVTPIRVDQAVFRMLRITPPAAQTKS